MIGRICEVIVGAALILGGPFVIGYASLIGG